MEYVVKKRQIALGGLAAASALAVSAFTAGAAFAAPVAGLPTAGLANVTSGSNGVGGLSSLQGLIC